MFEKIATDEAPVISAEYIGNRKQPYLWKLTRSIRILLPAPWNRWLRIPKGYTTNFASVPGIAQPIIPTQGPATSIAATVHDWLYDNQDMADTLGHKAARKRADDIFLALLDRYEPDRKFRNRIMYRAVRWFGKRQWDLVEAPNLDRNQDNPITYE
ncbi:DUF1353 domain-containing protein [Larkinella bovis]|uniref:DUF1353 domain-containing protein n=1 Tax=Larkinella bovis TaxID=683041 RepID=A0ABW0I668_9BACT